MNIIVMPRAQRDLDEAYAHIARDSQHAAERELGRLTEAIQRLANGELHGREVRLRSGRLVQRWPVPPYGIYYRRTSRTTTIFRVYHQARRPIE
jgi:plasmid stabilization system protein ParE